VNCEFGTFSGNAFAKKCFPDDDSFNSRQPISMEDIRKVQSLCKEIDA
jgi:hypothetical protein